MSEHAVCRAQPSIGDLTEKQLAVLVHLAQHKSSKQIAFDLGITQNTVDKHLTAVRRKWGTIDRYQTVQVFNQLQQAAENHPPRISTADAEAYLIAQAAPDLPKSAVFQLADVFRIEDFADLVTPPPVGLQALDQRFGKAWRIAAIPVLALLAFMVMLCAVNFAELLSDLM